MTPYEAAIAEVATLLERDPAILPCIVGPTASGKTTFASLVAARVGGEIVTADSVQIYKEFDLGSGKPTKEERALAPHHLISVVDPLTPIDAARFIEMADAAIGDIRARGRVPIVSGGTFLWVKALVSGLAPTPPASEEIRARHRALAAKEGRRALHDALVRVDPESAARLHPNDVVRTSRALEVFELLGRKMSELHAEHGFATERHRARLFAIERTSEILRKRIGLRVYGFLEAGWIEEVRSLISRGYASTRAMGSVGYKEIAAHLRGEITEPELPDTIVRATRVFARRQRTWLGREPVVWVHE